LVLAGLGAAVGRGSFGDRPAFGGRRASLRLPGIVGRARLCFVVLFHDPIMLRTGALAIRYLPKKTLRSLQEDRGGPW
jgi:hypothetical protein